jgi:hypothetical protein
MAKPQEEKVSFIQRLKQIGTVFTFTAKQDRWFVPLVTAAVLIPLAVSVALFFVFEWWVIPFGILAILLAVLIVLNTRSNAAMMNMMEGQAGAAGHLIEQMRGDWRVKQAVASTTQMDVVHLVIARPGVILIGEGAPQRVRPLITEQKRRLGKVIGDSPLYDYIIGNDEGQLSLRKLRMTLMRLPRNLSGKEVNALDRALTALTARPAMPRGALPKEFRPPKGARQNRGR